MVVPDQRGVFCGDCYRRQHEQSARDRKQAGLRPKKKPWQHRATAS